jgi:ATP-dependent Clp endopeptidase proteolytic subunit ClpP|tara:strand:- start:2545 stop:3540 length:996 start_codon:yes stop_codon:yes gene_type:complete
MKEILIYDVIGSFELTAKSIIEQLNEAKKEDVLVRINSVGGDVFEGMAIYNALIKHEGKVTVEIEGLSASMASIIMLAGDKVTASENSLIMVHNPSAGVMGESKDLSKRADLLDKMKEQMVSIYTGKSTLTEKQIVSMMDEETWFTSNEAMDVGLIDGVTEAIKIAAHFDLGKITNNVPDWVTEKYNNNKTNDMEEVKNMLLELKNVVANFITTTKEEVATEDVVVNIVDEDSIKAQIVGFSEKLGELEEINTELDASKSLIVTMEETIASMETEKSSLEAEINKHNAKPSEVESTEDPAVVTPVVSEESVWGDAANVLTDDAVFTFNTKK